MKVRAPIQEKFEEFHAAHPDVYSLFKRFCGELKSAGRTRYGSKSVIERIRWHYATTSEGEEFKINNNFTSRYARMLIDEHPEYQNFFELRVIRTA